MPDVLVVGAGPTGLLLANELRLAGADVLVIDRLETRSGQSKALSLQPRSAEILHSRGWLEPIRTREHTTLPAGHFAGIPLDYTVFDTDFGFQVGVEQADVERFLEHNLDGVVRRGVTLLDLCQREESVVATVEIGGVQRKIEAGYLVGADGGHSTVRRLGGFAFPGRDARMRMVAADITLSGKTDGVAESWQLPSFAERSGFLLPLRDGVYRVLFGGAEQQETPTDSPVTLAEVQRAVTEAFSPEIVVDEVRWASRFGDASRQAERYRIGRILLAGDAAHIHLPAGGQGMNLGLQDAYNLGWKLAAQVRGEAPDGLLDSYHAERHPVGAAVLANTRAQGVLTIPDPDVAALRDLVAGLLADPAANRRIAGQISGLGIRYPMPGSDHPLLGARMPDIVLADSTRLADHTRTGGPLLLAAPTYAGTADFLVTAANPGFDAALVRPDGHVCWLAGHSDEPLADAVGRWFGDRKIFGACHGLG
ncbi:FAD-dependent monooxygenase [Fodinicola acaciae]|uniref:FAD-dependent monooxygenase n=1 Tax=Fodinicola acaciae TaxID=2681555 RepID=UPI0013D8C604|nr:FAD-dependent monooxygenase [Fodinicola acaciae]